MVQDFVQVNLDITTNYYLPASPYRMVLLCGVDTVIRSVLLIGYITLLYSDWLHSRWCSVAGVTTGYMPTVST